MRISKRLGLSKGIFFILVFALFVTFSALTVSAATLRTTNASGQTQNDFSPGELVYIRGTGFEDNWIVSLNITKPNNVVDYGFALTNNVGSFTYIYDFGGMVGNYSVYASDGFIMKQVNFTDAAIWTTRNDCGNQTQNVNSYEIGDDVYINGDGFAAGNYSWEIKGQPGGASCDPNDVVASGIVSVNASGMFCFNAYTVENEDCGVYAVKVDNKGDNYNVEGGECEENDECGDQFSELQCSGLNVLNVTSTPLCVGDECIFNETQNLFASCGSATSNVVCVGNNVTNITNSPGCTTGTCFNETFIDTLEVCEFGCFNGSCLDAECGNEVVEDEEECDDGNLNNTDSCKNDCTLPFCGDEVLSVGEQCDDGGTENGDGCDSQCQIEVQCEDEDNDGVCDEVDACPDSLPNEPVDENGCDIFQFCSQSGFMCGDSCLMADWRDNEEDEYPNDCTVIIPTANGVPQSPICVPTEFNQQCAG